MNFIRLSFKMLLSNKKKYMLCLLGILMTVLLISTTLIISDSFSKKMNEEMNMSDNNNFILAFGDSENPLNNYQYLPLFRLIDVQDLKNKFSFIEDCSGIKLSFADKISNNSGKIIPAKNIFGINQSFLNIRNAKILNGNFPQEDNEVIIGNYIAKSGDISVGDKIQLTINGETQDFKVSGVLEKQEPKTFSSFPNEINNLIGANQTSNIFTNENFWFISVVLNENENLEEASDAISNNLNNMKYYQDSLQDSGLSVISISNIDVAKQIANWNQYINLFILVISVLCIIISIINIVFIIYSIIFNNRKQMAMAKTIGASNFQISALYIIQNVIVGVIGSSIGFALAILLSNLLSSLINWEAVLSINTVVVSIIIGVIIALLSALCVIKNAISIDIADTICSD